MDICGIILASGSDERMNSGKPKALNEILFKPVFDWAADAVKKAGAVKLCAVAGEKGEKLKEHLKDSGIDVYETESREDGFGTEAASEFVEENKDCDFLILRGNVPFCSQKDLKAFIKCHETAKADVTAVSLVSDFFSGDSVIVRSSSGELGEILNITDSLDAEEGESELFAKIVCVSGEALSELIKQDFNGSLEDIVNELVKQGKKAAVYKTYDERVLFSVESKEDSSFLNQEAREFIISSHLEKGVDIPVRDGVIIGPDCEIGRDTLILPGTIIKGKSVIGEDCEIGPNSYIENAEIGNGVKFNNGQIRRAKILDNADIGPFVQVRPDSVIGESVHLGNFVEVKNSVIDSGTKVSHLTYVGDSDVGSGVNFGCGVVTVNYTGKSKHRTTIKDGAFIGCNTNLVAPVTVGRNSYTAAGSTITEDVPDNSLGIARERQVNKENWVIKKQPYKKKIEE